MFLLHLSLVLFLLLFPTLLSNLFILLSLVLLLLLCLHHLHLIPSLLLFLPHLLSLLCPLPPIFILCKPGPRVALPSLKCVMLLFLITLILNHLLLRLLPSILNGVQLWTSNFKHCKNKAPGLLFPILLIRTWWAANGYIS